MRKNSIVIPGSAESVNFREIIHCHAGVERTGFVCIVLEAFMGATLNEIINDYLQSFNSIYNSGIYGELNKSDSIVVMQLLSAKANWLITQEQ
jgi:protein tyrosine/serine phosphatase